MDSKIELMIVDIIVEYVSPKRVSRFFLSICFSLTTDSSLSYDLHFAFSRDRGMICLYFECAMHCFMPNEDSNKKQQKQPQLQRPLTLHSSSAATTVALPTEHSSPSYIACHFEKNILPAILNF